MPVIEVDFTNVESGAGALPPGVYEAQVVSVSERRTERLDAKLARAIIPPDLLPQVLTVSSYKVLTIKEVTDGAE